MGAGASAKVEVALQEASPEELEAALRGLPPETLDKIREVALADPGQAAGDDADDFPLSAAPPMLMREISGCRHVTLPGIDDVLPGKEIHADLEEAQRHMLEGPRAHDDDALLQPALVRGLTRTERKDHLLAQLVAEALKNEGWAEVDVSTIQVKDTSGFGGSKTYKVWAEGVQPVALHSRSEEVSEDELSDPRAQEAAILFSQYGVAPRRLAYGSDWFIEPWEGSGAPALSGETAVTQAAALLAKVHKIPTDWFDKWRERLVARFAESFPEAVAAGNGLDAVPLGSHVWWFTCRKKWLLEEIVEPRRSAWLAEHFFAPVSEVGSRIVTTHGDLHPGNMIQLDDSIRCLDFEFSIVTSAAQDLGYTMNCIGGVELKRLFIKTYLVNSGFSAEECDVDAVYLDAAVATLGYHFGRMGMFQAKADEWPVRVAKFKVAVATMRADPSAMLAGTSLQEYAESLPEAVRVVAEYTAERVGEEWAKLPALPQKADLGQLAVLARHSTEEFGFDIPGFSVFGWLCLQPHQRYTEDGALLVASCSAGVAGFEVGIKDKSLRFCHRGSVAAPAVPRDGPEERGDALFDGQWHHAVFAYDAEAMTLSRYLDGELQQTTTLLAARPVRLTSVCVGGYAARRIPMDTYTDREKMLVIRVCGHKDRTYNGIYVQEEGTHCGKPFFKNQSNRWLKKYNAEAGGDPDWSLDHRRPDVTKDWCAGGWYPARPDEDLVSGERKWDCGHLVITWGEIDPSMVGDPNALEAAIAAQPTERESKHWRSEFPEEGMGEVTLWGGCIDAGAAAQLFHAEVHNRPRPNEPIEIVPLETVYLEKTLSWEGHHKLALELGGSLATRMDIILNSISAGKTDAWIPVIRDDGEENDWVQIGDQHPHPIYISHKDRFGPPGWGTTDEPNHWRPMYFFMRKNPVACAHSEEALNTVAGAPSEGADAVDLSEEQIANVKAAFTHIDQDQSGQIDLKELTAVMAGLRSSVTEEEIAESFAKLDVDGNGVVDFDEYLNMVRSARRGN